MKVPAHIMQNYTEKMGKTNVISFFKQRTSLLFVYCWLSMRYKVISNMWHISLQKATYYKPICHLLQIKRSSFRKRLDVKNHLTLTTNHDSRCNQITLFLPISVLKAGSFIFYIWIVVDYVFFTNIPFCRVISYNNNAYICKIIQEIYTKRNEGTSNV